MRCNNSYILISSGQNLMLFAGVYLVLKGHFIANNSHINIRSIGQSSDSPNGALQCITDKSPSDCRHRHGEWYLPNGIRNRVTDQYYMFHRSEGHMHTIIYYLNRPPNIMTPTGQFCCKVLDATYILQTHCVIIGKHMYCLCLFNSYCLHNIIIDNTSVTLFGSPTAGETYTLEYSTGNSAALFEWLGPPDGRTPVTYSGSSLTISSDSSRSQLQFRPLQQSHDGS